jgi:hypothetical protein
MDAEQIKAAIGGDAEFERISSWATENLQPADLAEYNRVVDEGNKDAISAWLRLLRQGATAAIGGDAEFERISSWATENLQPADLAEYNRVVDEGNKDAISAWLRLLRQGATAAKPEPALIGGGSAAGADRFESDRDAINARAALNSRGQNRYDTEPAYRKWFEAALARSNVFQ